MSVSCTHLLSHFTATQPQPQSDCHSDKDIGGTAVGCIAGGILLGGALVAIVAKLLGFSRGMLRLCNNALPVGETLQNKCCQGSYSGRRR